MYTYVIIAIVLVLVLMYVKRFQKPANSPPYEAGLIPYLGLGAAFGANPLQLSTEMYKKHGHVFTLNVLGNRLTFLASPEAHEPFLKGSDVELDQNEPYKFAIPLFGPGVVYDVDLATRNQQLKFMRGSLKTDKMRSYVPQIVHEAEQFFANWGDEGEVDIRKELSELIILTASRCLMGPEIREHLSGEIARLFQQIDEGLTTLSVFFPNLPIPRHKRRDQARESIIELFAKVMRERKTKPDETYDDVLQVFMDARYKDGTGLADSEVAGMMIALLFAGQHTSSITSSWTGLLLMAHKEFLGPVLEEQEKVLAAHNGELNYDALQEMDKLHYCVKEALRMYPPLIFLMRKLCVDKEIGGYTIPKGDTLFLSPALSGRLETVFTNPDKFDPDRYAPPREEDKQKPFSYVGFGGGRHGCMGEIFAYLQVKTIWSVLLRNFEMEIVGEFPKPDYSAMVVGPTQPCLVKYKRIRSQ